MANVLLIHRDGTISGPFDRNRFKEHHIETNSDDFRLVLDPVLHKTEIWEYVPAKNDKGEIDLSEPGTSRQKFVVDINLLFSTKKLKGNIVPMTALKVKVGE